MSCICTSNELDNTVSRNEEVVHETRDEECSEPRLRVVEDPTAPIRQLSDCLDAPEQVAPGGYKDKDARRGVFVFTEVDPMNVQFVTSIAPIVRDADASRSFYRDALGLSFEGEVGDYLFTHKLEGTKHFGLWPLSEAANACFGTTEWPAEIPVPQASIEFEVADVTAAAAELTTKGYRLIHDGRTEPWGQITARLLSPEGLLVAVCYSPFFHDTEDG